MRDGYWQIEKFKHFVEREIEDLGLGDAHVELFNNLRTLEILVNPVEFSVVRHPLSTTSDDGAHRLVGIKASRGYLARVNTRVTPDMLCVRRERFNAWVQDAVRQICVQAMANNEPQIIPSEPDCPHPDGPFVKLDGKRKTLAQMKAVIEGSNNGMA